MYRLRLIKALSYDGIISATAKHPDVYTEDKAIANAAVASGYFIIVEQPEEAQETPPAIPDETGEGGGENEAPDYEALSKQTKAELTEYAQAHGISLDGCKTKADILEAISVANGGSYTMMELQEEV